MTFSMKIRQLNSMILNAFLPTSPSHSLMDPVRVPSDGQDSTIPIIPRPPRAIQSQIFSSAHPSTPVFSPVPQECFISACKIELMIKGHSC